MTLTQTQNIQDIEKKLIRLERLFHAHLKQEEDWLDEPKLVKRLDEISETEQSILAKDADL